VKRPSILRRPALFLAAAIAITAWLIVLENFGGSSLNRLLLYLPGADKPLHVAQSFLIGHVMLLLAGRLPVSPGVRLATAATAAIVLALFDEWQQQWFGRTIETADVVAGLSGVALALASTQVRRAPRLAAAGLLAGAVVATAVTAQSYGMTKDFNRGLLAEERGDMAAAYHHFRDARAAGVRTAELFNYLAWTAVESGLGPPDAAVRDAEESLRLRPGNPDTLDTYGWALHQAGRSAEAIAPLTQALKLKPRIYCIHYHLGAAYLEIGERELARVHLQQQVEQLPGSREARAAAALLGRLRAAAAE
jgi:tetratricopeptide (TPR) repeat protein